MVAVLLKKKNHHHSVIIYLSGIVLGDISSISSEDLRKRADSEPLYRIVGNSH